MNCRNYQDHLKAFLDGELRGWRHWRVSRHVQSCDACLHACRELNQLSRRLQAMDAPSVPAGLRERILQTVGTKNRMVSVRKRRTWRWAYAVPLVLMMGVIYAVHLNNSFPLPSGVEVTSPAAISDRYSHVPAPSSAMKASVPKEGLAWSVTDSVPKPLLSNEPSRVSVYTDVPLAAAPQSRSLPEGQSGGNASAHVKPGVWLRAAGEAPVHEVVVQIEVQDLNRALHSVMKAARSQGAVMRVSGYELNRTTASYADIELQIPVRKLDALMMKLYDLGKVTSEKVRYIVEPSEQLSLQDEAGKQSEAESLGPPPGIGQADKSNMEAIGQEPNVSGPGTDLRVQKNQPLGVDFNNPNPQLRANLKFKESQGAVKRENKSHVPLPVVKVRLLLPK